MAEALSFLMSWVHDNINPTVYNDKAGAEYLAEECLRDAKKVGFQEADLNTAARRGLARFMLTHLNRAVVRARRASPRRSDHNNLTAGRVGWRDSSGDILRELCVEAVIACAAASFNTAVCSDELPGDPQ